MKKRQRVRRKIINFSLYLFPLTLNYFSPAVIIMGAIAGIVTGSFLVFVLLFLSSLFWGRAYCGWVCPGAGLQETLFKIKNKRVKTGKVDLIKYFAVWFPWITLIVVMFIKAGGITSIDPIYMTPHGISISDLPSTIRFVMIVVILSLLPVIFGKRAFCHYGCWMAPFMVFGTMVGNALKLPGLRLVSEKNKCTNCLTCNTQCPMSLDVNRMVHNPTMGNSECILCGSCVDNCPESVISYSFRDNCKKNHSASR